MFRVFGTEVAGNGLRGLLSLKVSSTEVFASFICRVLWSITVGDMVQSPGSSHQRKRAKRRRSFRWTQGGLKYRC